MNLTQESKILVIAAHPDDEILGCGGVLAKARSINAEVRVVFLGEGISARFPIGQYSSLEFSEQTKLRQGGAERALKLLTIQDVHFSNRLCCQFDHLPLLSIVKEIEQHIADFCPTILLTHNPAEVNIDHQITYRAVEVACRPTRLSTPKEIYTFEVVCSGSWTFEDTFRPNLFVDIEPFWEKKMAAWQCYEGEDRPFPFPRSIEGLKTLAQYRGLMSGLKKAEAFRLMRQVIS